MLLDVWGADTMVKNRQVENARSGDLALARDNVPMALVYGTVVADPENCSNIEQGIRDIEYERMSSGVSLDESDGAFRSFESGRFDSDDEELPVVWWKLWMTTEWATAFKSVVGSGFFALPYAFKVAGYGGGILVMLVLLFVTLLTTKQLIQSARKYLHIGGSCSEVGFTELGNYVFSENRAGRIFFMLSMVLSQYISIVAYIVFLQNSLAPMLQELLKMNSVSIGEYGSSVVVVSVVVLIEMIISLSPDPSFLHATSMFGNVAFLASMVFIVVAGMELSPPSAAKISAFESVEGIFACFGIASFSISAQAECLSIYSSSKKRARMTFGLVVDQVTVFVAILFSSIALFGYACFGDDTNQSIFKNFTESGSLPGRLLVVCICAMLLFNYPLTLFPVHQMAESSYRQATNQPSRSNRRLNRYQIFSRFTIVMSSGLLAILFGGRFGDVSEAGGAFTALLCCIFPPIIYASFHGGFKEMSTLEKIVNGIVILFGITICVTSLATGFLGLAR